MDRYPRAAALDVYIVALDPRVGTKPGKQRPCLPIQPTEFGEAGLPSTVVLALTTRIVHDDAFPLRVRIPAGFCGLDRDSDILVDQLNVKVRKSNQPPRWHVRVSATLDSGWPHKACGLKRAD